MSMFMYVLVAASFGWIASQILPHRSSLLINVVAAAVGALLAGLFLTPLLHVGSLDKAISIPVPLLGSLLLLGVVQFIPL